MRTKEYRLLKWYPSLPCGVKEGDIFTKEENSNTYYSKELSKFVYDREVENHPEFWEEVTPEKDWEILSVISTIHNDVRGEGCILTIGDPDSYTHKYNLKEDSSWDIYSVKRLSDGVVFSLGDKVVHKGNVTHPNGEITKLHIVGNSMFVTTNKRVNGFDTDINLIVKQRKSIFTTEDGVDIYKGDEYTAVNKDLTMTVGWVACTKESFGQHGFGKKFFSTREAAEQYILFNKKQLSLNDVFSVYPQFTKKDETKLTSHAEKLINFVKNEKV